MLHLKKRSGEKMEVDQAMFNSFDTNGDGVASLKGLRRTSTRRRARRSRRSSTAGHSMRTRGCQSGAPRKRLRNKADTHAVIGESVACWDGTLASYRPSHLPSCHVCDASCLDARSDECEARMCMWATTTRHARDVPAVMMSGDDA